MRKREEAYNARIADLEKQKSLLEQTLKANTRSEVFAHGRFSGSTNPYLTPQGIKSVWTRTTNNQAKPSSSSSSSSSSSMMLSTPSSTLQFQHSSSAKRQREPSPDLPSNYSEYKYGDFNLFDGCASSSQDDDYSRSSSTGVQVFAHSRDSPGQRDTTKRHCGILSRLHSGSSHNDIVRGLALSAVRGERYTGLTQDIIDNSAYTLAPDLFTQLLVRCNGSMPLTNKDAGIFGFEDPRYSPHVLGYSGTLADDAFKSKRDQIGISKF
jgi:hypothetical protein